MGFNNYGNTKSSVCHNWFIDIGYLKKKMPENRNKHTIGK